MATIEIRRLTKRFDDEPVVRDVDLSVRDGELLAILGPSGSGKSSLLRMVAGLEPITSGEVVIEDRRGGPSRRPHERPAMMFQEAALYPHLTVRENLAFPLRMRGAHRRTVTRRVDEVAAVLGLGPLLDRRPRTLSGGQRQRVAMGRALIREPDVLLMDEPMSNLDAKLRGELRALIGHLQRELGITTLYVTHDQVEAMSLGHRVALMRHGEIVQIGPPDDLHRRPADVFVATFVGQPAINLFVGEVVVDGGLAELRVGSYRWRLDDRWTRSVGSQRVVVGVRPHAIGFADHGPTVDVERATLVGDRWQVDARLAAQPVEVVDGDVEFGSGTTMLRIDLPAGDEPGSGLWRPSHLAIATDDIHLFAAGSGRSLGLAAAPTRGQSIRATT